MFGIRIVGTGSYLPGPPLDQDTVRTFLRRYPDGLDERMQERLLAETGIATRHYAIELADESRREANVSMCEKAGRHALAAAGWTPDDVDLLVVTTVIPDQLVPPTSTLVQEALGIERCAELEVSANCTAPYKGLMFAADALRLGRYRRALICSSQLSSVFMRPPWANPSAMAPHHGGLRWVVSDGAGAVALEQAENDCGLMVWLESVGYKKRPGMSLALGAAYPDLSGGYARGDHHIRQEDRYVLKEGLSLAISAVRRMLDELEIEPSAIAHFLPAVSSLQVARHLQEVIEAECNIAPDVWRMNFTRVGYLGGVGCFVILDELIRAKRIRRGELVCAFAEESSKWMCAGLVFRWDQ